MREDDSISKTNASSKRNGRKAKGAKLINKKLVLDTDDNLTSNIVLHLNCSITDLFNYNENMNKQIKDPTLYIPDVPPDIQTYNNNSHNYMSYDATTEPLNTVIKCEKQFAYSYICSICSSTNKENFDKKDESSSSFETEPAAHLLQSIDEEQNLREKIAEMKVLLQNNQLNKKKSACFWCTCDFENADCGIPLDDDNQYGCFCTPECAVAFLMKEQIDDSVKFERYHLLNQRYGKIFKYIENIKPAPNPHYT